MIREWKFLLFTASWIHSTFIEEKGVFTLYKYGKPMIGYVARYMLTSHFAHIDVSEEDNSHREESVDTGHGVRVETAIN